MSISSDELHQLEESVAAALIGPANDRQRLLYLVEKRLREEQRPASPDLNAVGTLFALCLRLRESLSRGERA
jgi:hypothetical protein